MLDKISGIAAKAAEPFSFPTSVPRHLHARRLFDLVEPADDDVRTAFYFAMRDTLVAKDLDTASALAYGSSGGARRVGRAVLAASPPP